MNPEENSAPQETTHLTTGHYDLSSPMPYLLKLTPFHETFYFATIPSGLRKIDLIRKIDLMVQFCAII